MPLAGHPVKLYVKASSASPIAGDEVDGLNNVSYSPSVDLLDITDFKDTSGAKLKLAGLLDGSISLSGDFEMSDAPQALIRSSMVSGASLWTSCHFNPSGSTGSKGFIVETKVASFEIATAVDGKVTFSASLQFTGAPAVDS
jgi:predicted secreted protein